MSGFGARPGVELIRSVSKIRQNELRDALEDSPIVICFNLFIRQLLGWPFYLFINASGQRHYPPGTNRER